MRLDSEPPDAEVEHRLSGRTLTAFRAGGQLHHRQTLIVPAEGGALTEEHALSYAIGSGRHSRSYLAQLDGFLVESPLTWYAARQQWGPSPGYDHVEHLGFERQADQGCLVCHAGRVEMEHDNRDRVILHEPAIGCESCHGPGSVHVQTWRQKRETPDASGPTPSGKDLTIVHPAQLGRREQESICAGCHLRGVATVSMRGRRIDDFRPSQRLSDFRVDYIPSRSDRPMTVVGHVEQMRASPCYQKSDSLTCLTCHDPHDQPSAAERIGHYRERCNGCHQDQCGLPRDQRLKREPEDDCTACHMPRRPTDVPHFAFTHHRIGLHGDGPQGEQKVGAASLGGAAELVPLEPLLELSPADRDRCLGLAYVEFAEKQADVSVREECLARGERLLASAEGQAGDAQVIAALARIALERGDLLRARALAAAALQLDDMGSGARTTALIVAGTSAFQMRDHRAAIPPLRELTTRRRRSEDWVLLGRAQGAAGDLPAALTALTKAAEIQPFRQDIRVLLAGTYSRLNQPDEAHRQESLAAALAATDAAAEQSPPVRGKPAGEAPAEGPAP